MENTKISYQEVIEKVSLILKPELSFYSVSIIYGIAVSVLTLAIPISVQSLVNTVTFGVLSQPLIVLSIVLFALLLFSGVFNALQTYIIELFQRHFYVRTTSDIAVKLLNANYKHLGKINGVELVNRYFDVMTVQKSVATLLTGGTAIILQTFVGLVLLAFYHPFFLVFDVLLLGSLWLVWIFFADSALFSATMESKSKYKVASWLEELARSNLFFKTSSRKEVAVEKSDLYINEYLLKRRKHFRLVFLQTILLLAIYAVMSSLILGLGGFLVIKGQLTIGQLVAAELVTTIILASFSKAGKYLESFYDLYAAIDKLSHFYNMPLELASETKTQLIDDYDLNFLSAQVKESRYDFYFNYNFEAGKKYFIHSKFYSSKLVFLELAQGLIKPQRGSIEIGNARFSQLSVFNIKDLIYIVDSPTILEASIIENLRIGNSELDNEKLRTVLELVDLAHLEDFFKEGLQTKLIPSGYPLWSSQIIRLEIARALLSPAKILIITEIFDQVEDKRREKILNYIISEKRTLILFSHKEIYNFKFDKFLMMERDMITAYPSLAKLRENISQ